MKAKEWFDLKNNIRLSENNFLFVKSEYKQQKLNIDEILLFEGLKDYVKIWMQGQSKPILSLMSLKSVEQELATHNFMRIHRSYVISLKKIESLERGQVVIDKHRIMVADQYKEKFLEYVIKNSI
jgi:DNA-binding LytR/AlgR family response regulator